MQTPVYTRAVIFDFIGTLVIEKDPSILNQCFVKAFKDHNANVGIELIKANRGKDKKEMIEDILTQSGLPPGLTGPVLQSFRFHLTRSLSNFGENEGATAVIEYLKERKIMIGLGSGLPRDIFEMIFEHIGWSAGTFDYIGIAEETGRGRPHPDMIFDMMKKLSLGNEELLKVGDTVADVMEGKNAKVMTVAILSGTQDEHEILNSQPGLVIRSLKEIKDIFDTQFRK